MSNENASPSVLKKAFLASLPVMAGYMVLGAGFGMIMKDKGFGIGWSFAMSLFIYAGSMQYVAIPLLCGGAGLLTTALTTLMVNARHLFYGFSMIDKYRDTGKAKPYLIFALTDETYSIVCTRDPAGPGQKKFYLLLSLLDQCYWVTGSLLGALLGTVLPISTEGMDFALTALFVVIFIDQWRNTKEHAPAVLGLACAVLALLIFGPDRFLIPAMLLIIASLLLLQRRKGARGA